MQTESLDLIRRIVEAIEDCQTLRGEINPYTFFNHYKLSNWLTEAKAMLDQTEAKQ